VANPKQITTLAFHQNNGQWEGTFSWPEFKEIRAQSQNSFSNIMAGTTCLDGFAMAGQPPERIMTGYVSGNFFDALGAQPAAGRLFLRSAGEVLGRDPAIVLSYDFWKERFNGDPNVVGRQVTVDGHSLSIIGVAPKRFPGLFGLATITAYLPLSELTIEGTSAAFLLLPNAPMATDKQAIRASWASLLGPEVSVSRQARMVEVARSGERPRLWAFIR